jgi:hypothetical protein
MLGNEFSAATPAEALRATSFSAGANNGPWLPVKNLEGMLAFLYNAGAITGSVVFKLQDATDGSGTGAADLSPAVASASITTAGTTGILSVEKRKVRSHVRLVATVTTGPVLAAAVLMARDKMSPPSAT